MPVTYEILSDLVVFTASGRVIDDDFRLAFEKATADPRFIRGSKLLTYDIESALEPSTSDPKQAAETINSFMEYFEPRIAVVVHKEESIGLGLLIRKHCEEFGIEYQVFNDPGAAKEWLFPGGF